MRIVDALTFETIARNEPDRKLVMIRFEDKQIACYHAKCMASKSSAIGRSIAGTTDHYAVHLLDEVGPQPPCRGCERY